MKSSLRLDEIFGVPPQMKLNPPSYPDEVGFHHEVISSHDSGIYPVRKDGFSWKKMPLIKHHLFHKNLYDTLKKVFLKILI